MFQSREAFGRSHSVLGGTKFVTHPGSSPGAMLQSEETVKRSHSILGGTKFLIHPGSSPDAMLQSEETFERSRSVLGGTELVTQSDKVVNHVNREKTKYTYQECEKMCAGKKRGCDTCANFSQRSSRAQETSRRDRV